MNTNEKHLSEGVKRGLLFLGVLILLSSLCGGLFYWYEYRPAQIRKDCSWETKELLREPRKAEYDFCIHSKGL